jgi:hypothetical protein
LAQHPHGPSPFYPVKHIGVLVNDPCLAVLLPAVEADLDFPLQGRKIPLQHLVEVDDFAVGVIDDLDL